ncbi:MAG: hypothetical protein ACKOI2_00840 [Actinomycetota bacterium]
MNATLMSRLLAIAERLVPTTETMVGAGSVPDAEKFIERALASRPDLGEGLEVAVLECTDELVDAAVRGESVDASAFDQVATLVIGAYYMNPVARRQIGYPGQLALEYDPMEYVTWVNEGLLDQVMNRGPRYREVTQ